MDRKQAEAITQALLEPHARALEERRGKRAAEAERTRRRRRVAWFVLAGCASGGALAHLAGAGIGTGSSWGGTAGAVLGWTLNWLRRRSPSR